MDESKSRNGSDDFKAYWRDASDGCNDSPAAYVEMLRAWSQSAFEAGVKSAATVSEQQLIDREDYLRAASWSAEEERPESSLPADYAHNSAIKFARIIERLYERSDS